MTAWTRRQLIPMVVGASSLSAALVVAQRLSGAQLPGANTQQPLPIVGYLGTSARNPDASPLLRMGPDAFVEGLRELGYVEGSTVTIEWRLLGDLPGASIRELAAELVARPVQVIVTSSTPAVVAAAQATHAIPIVSGGPNRDLVDLGLVESDARPGRNVTGTGANLATYAKLVDLLKSTLPDLSRVGYLRNPATPGTETQMARARNAAATLGIDFLELTARTPAEIDRAFEYAVAAGAEGLIVSADAAFGAAPGLQVTNLPLHYGLPTIYSQVEVYLDEGGLLAYAPDFTATQRRAAVYVDKILRGARPSELPVEQASSFELGINLATARAMGVRIPEHVVLQATRVIQ